jgi:hypothetical protein
MKIVKKTIHKKLPFYQVPVSIILIQRAFKKPYFGAKNNSKISGNYLDIRKQND